MKHKEKRKHLEKPCNIQQAVPQSFVEAPGCTQAAGENTSSSDYYTGVSSPHKLLHHDEDGFHQLKQNVSYLGSLNMPVSRSAGKRKIMEGHIEGYRNTQLNTPCPESRVEAPGCSQAAGENASSSEYFTCVSSPSKLPRLNEDGYPNTQLNTPCPESRVEAPGCSQAAGENASSSEYFTCVSSPSKLPRLNEDGIKERLVPKDMVQTKSSSDYSCTSLSSYSASNKDRFMSSEQGTDQRLMKIYYMRVQMKRGVAVLCQTEEGWEPPSKKSKIHELTYVKEVQKNVPLSHMPGKNPLIVPEPSVDSRAQEKTEKADCSARPPNLVAYRRVQLRMALLRGFRCMACCHVFSSLQLLQEHVENGIREGFSCHVFHQAMAYMKYKRLKRKN